MIFDENKELKLINFEYATKECKEELHHNLYTPQNFLFLSANLLEKNNLPSFKDDIIAFFQILVFLLSDSRIINQNGFLLNPTLMLNYREINPLGLMPVILFDHMTLFGKEQDQLPEKDSLKISTSKWIFIRIWLS